MADLQVNAVYTVELCSGERRAWQYLGLDSRRLVWWLDKETGDEFNENALMYAWKIIDPEPEVAAVGAEPGDQPD